jgi:hypothetical protein
VRDSPTEVEFLLGVVPALLFAAIAFFTAFMCLRYGKKQTILQRASAVVVVVFFLSQANYWLFHEWCGHKLGGYPSGGMTNNGHYYVGDRSRFSEVSYHTYTSYFRYELYSERLLDLSWLVVVGCGLLYGYRRWRNEPIKTVR